MAKTALITGATSGLGYEFVKLFAKDGYDLVLVARTAKKLEKIKETFTSTKVHYIVKDLSVPGAAKEIFKEIEQADIPIDILVNNAGFGLLGAFDGLDIQEQLQMVQLNIAALTELSYYVLPGMKEKGGRILNVSSTAAFQPGPYMAVYFATKAYVLSFSEALAEELKSSEATVTVLCPGPTQTRFGTVAGAEGTRMFSRTMAPERVARLGYEALMNGKRAVVAGGMNRAGTIAAKLLPISWTAKAAKYVMGEK
ncbi:MULTISPECIES: SDR family NAD(P)-dependent oxidoreductase [unclassified Sporolactobacillus]|uniref:SDR family NAD(P)-dependent oxidoreductase n=1 Tax=unclassified Sporolactobacillus TaxID=2628533 RepID=UPI002368BC46|nr:SDR family oxidoreductase [Sporolactobacillus sp. CQH2019]MDD9148745.1 SDR family oxidoreductase [Sporolactobacillus sp. CQH2019]